MARSLSPVRRFILWWMSHPNSPYVSANFAVEFGAARDYLERLNADPARPRVSVTHLFTAAVARTYARFPAANARVLGHSIRRERHVGVAAPVNLLDQAGEAGMGEVSVVIVPRAEELGLRQLAERMRRSATAERSGEPQLPLTRLLLAASRLLPDRLMHRGLDASWSLLSQPALGPITGRLLPVTVGVTNPGSAFGDIEGLHFRGAAFNLPGPGWCVGSVFGLTPIQDEVLAVDGRPVIRPVLPVLFIFDHRLFDGVMAGRISAHLAGILRDPEATFGPPEDA